MKESFALASALLTAGLFCAFLSGCSPADPAATTPNATASRVVRTTRRLTTQLVTLRTSETTIVTTPEHPFAKLGTGWTPASELAVGDRIVTHGAQHAALVGVEVRQVSPTPVYNLTVAKTHAYFVSERALLVHNADCGERSLEDIMREQDAIVKQRQRALLERLDEQRRERKRAEIRQYHATFQQEQRDKLALQRKTFNDSGSDNKYCAYCSLGALSDFDKLSSFFKETNMTAPSPSMTMPQVYAMMDRLGLRDETTPGEGVFAPKNGESANDFMKASSSNTFIVNTFIVDLEAGRAVAHSLLAVRRDDGSITYLDMQKIPPEAYDSLDPRLDRVFVQPTTVDWRYNRTLFKAIQNTPIQH